MFHNKPIIGLAGGIGSGKSYVAGLFAELGCAVIDADATVRELYRQPAVLRQLQAWWGDGVLLPDGSANRSAIAKIIFASEADRLKLEQFVHPQVARVRAAEMTAVLYKRPSVPAFIWDIPLLFENSLDRECDALVFIEAPSAERLARVAGRGWTGADLAVREKTQWGLDKKKAACKDVIVNSAEHADDIRRQVGTTLSRILENTPNPAAGH